MIAVALIGASHGDHLATIVTARPTRQRVFLVIMLFITLLFSFLDRINMSVLLADSTFLIDLGIKNDTVKMGLLMSVFLIIYAAANVVFGPLGDLLGSRKAILICLPVWAAAMLGGSFAPTFAWMLASRGVLGLGEGMHYPVQMKFVKNWFPPLERGKANSVWQFSLFVGPAIAMPFFAWQVNRFGWRMSFITTLEEKSLGCIYKAGSSQIQEVIAYACKPTRKGLVYMDTPAHDIEQLTAMVAGGAQIVTFTTGRGTPCGSPIAPVIKITGNRTTFVNMRDNMDLDVSKILRGNETVLRSGKRVFEEIIACASGKETKAERLNQRDFSIFKINPNI